MSRVSTIEKYTNNEQIVGRFCGASLSVINNLNNFLTPLS